MYFIRVNTVFVRWASYWSRVNSNIILDYREFLNYNFLKNPFPYDILLKDRLRKIREQAEFCLSGEAQWRRDR